MPLNLSVPTVNELKPKISVIGIGGAGGNAVNNMISSQLDGVDFLVANTDAQAIGLAQAEKKVQLGADVTRGLGAGSEPNVGRAAAEESLEEVMAHIEGANMLFITAGMGGGTGTGAAPVIARAARDKGILTVGVVTKPFHFEGARRMRIAESGIIDLQQYVDTLLIIPNQNLFRLADDSTTFTDAFAMADEVLHSGVRGITDLMIVPGLINLDFADVRTVMSEMGKAMMGTGEADGEKRAVEAADAAISNPLLDEVSMKGARGVLINITGGMDMRLFEVDEAANRIRSEVDPDANIIVGSTFAQNLEGRIRVSVVATGIDAAREEKEHPPAVSNKTTHGYVQNVQGLSPIGQQEGQKPQENELPFTPDAAATPYQHVSAQQQAATKKTVITRYEPREEIVFPQKADNPVGKVHDRIRRMLTEDEQGAVRPTGNDTVSHDTPAGTHNPFQTARDVAAGSLKAAKAAVGLLAETFSEPHAHSSSEHMHNQHDHSTPQPKDDAPPRSASLFQENGDEDLEIPAFLRRRGGGR